MTIHNITTPINTGDHNGYAYEGFENCKIIHLASGNTIIGSGTVTALARRHDLLGKNAGKPETEFEQVLNAAVNYEGSGGIKKETVKAVNTTEVKAELKANLTNCPSFITVINRIDDLKSELAAAELILQSINYQIDSANDVDVLSNNGDFVAIVDGINYVTSAPRAYAANRYTKYNGLRDIIATNLKAYNKYDCMPAYMEVDNSLYINFSKIIVLQDNIIKAVIAKLAGVLAVDIKECTDSTILNAIARHQNKIDDVKLDVEDGIATKAVLVAAERKLQTLLAVKSVWVKIA